ncbi:hypothetical protein C8F01DRAFT_1151762, partial [Mycena amicta]
MTTTTQPQPNLVPTIESSMLPSTPAHEWAEKMTGELDTSAERVGAQAPKNREELVPGSYPGEREDEGGETLMPAEEDVQQTITSVGQMVKDMLPEALKAYLPSTSPPSSATPAATTNAPPFLNESTAVDSRTSTTTNLSTEAQAGSLLPPRLDSESIVEESDPLATPRTESVSLPAVPLSVVSNSPVLPGLSADPNADANADGASSHLSTRVHTGSSASPNPVPPSLPIPEGPNSNAGLDHSNSSRFIERLSSSSSVTPDSQSTSQSSPKVDLGLTHTASPEPLSVSSSSGTSNVHVGTRAPRNTLTSGETPLVERGAPNVLATPPAGVFPPELTPTEDEDEDEAEGEGEGEG